MKISLNLLHYYTDRFHWSKPLTDDIDELAARIGAQLGGVEEIVDFGSRFNGIPVVKIVSCVDHPNSDHLHICKVDDGGVIKDVPRDSEGLVQIITGAPNVRDNFVAAWLPPGSTVPESLSKEPFALEARPLRGEVSYGMLASARELTLGDNHEGIMELDRSIKPGTWLADALDLRGEYIIDIENKMFTHRPDCFGLLGVARELAGIYHDAFHSPAWYRQDAPIASPEKVTLPVTLRNDVPELVPRFLLLSIADVTIKPSPLGLQTTLSRLGVRPINNVVDLTNYFMLLTGQPLHAYDYDKVKAQDPGTTGAHFVIRHPAKNEKLELLSGKTVSPSEQAIFIATETKAIGLAGIMGGGNTEVDDSTKNIVLECGTFDMYTIRRVSMASGVFTDAVTRFTKGQSPLQNRAVMAHIAQDVLEHAGGTIAGPLIDDNHLPDAVLQRGNLHAPVTVTRTFIADRLGLDSTTEEMAQLLRNVEFAVETHDETLVVSAPFWRTDIAIPEDIVEEVGRLYGYDQLPLVLPKRDLAPAARNKMYDLKTRIANYLSKSGATEVLTYSFVHGRLLEQVGQNPELAFQLSNALSPDLQYYRTSLSPSLLDKVHANSKAGHEAFAIFELNKVHAKNELDEAGLPREFQCLALVFATSGKTAKQYYGAPFFQAKVYLQGLFASFGFDQAISYKPLNEVSFAGHAMSEQLSRPFETNRAAAIVKDNQVVGVVGEYRASVRKALKLPDACAGFELLASVFEEAPNRTYVPLPRFPKVEQDICLRVPKSMTYQTVYDFVLAKVAEHQPENVLSTLCPIDIYGREQDTEHKQITLRLSIASYERTLTDAQVAKVLDAVAAAAKAELHAERI